MEKTYYVCGGVYGAEGTRDSFQLVTGSREILPYITTNPESRLMRHCGHHSALYRVGRNGQQLYNMHDSHYELTKREPDGVVLTPELVNIIALAIKERRTFI